MEVKMKVGVFILIGCLQFLGVFSAFNFAVNPSVKDQCEEKPGTDLLVGENVYTEYVEVIFASKLSTVKARTLFIDAKEKVVIKSNLKSYGNRAFSDFMPYTTANVTTASGASSNKTTFGYKRHGKAEDQVFEVTFYKGFYLGNLKDKDFFQLLGLSQQWLGCPQPMCLFGTVDAAFHRGGKLYITRGPWFWDLSTGPPRSSNRQELQHFVGQTVPVIDSAMSTGNNLWFFKEKRVYCVIGGAKTCPGFATSPTNYHDLPSFFSVEASKAFTPETCEAAFSFADQDNAKVALYGESELRKLAIFTKKATTTADSWYQNEKVIDFPLIFQRKIDAMVNIGGTVTIFMGWNNYKVPLNAFESSAEIDNKKSASFVSFEDPFKCPKDIYKGWVYDYDKYAEEMNQIVQTEVPKADFTKRIDILDTAQRVGTAKPSDEQSALPFILAAILLAVIIIVIIVILTEKKRRARKKTPQDNKPEEVDLRAPAMGSNIDTRSVMGSQILESEYRPGKKLPRGSKSSQSSKPSKTSKPSTSTSSSKTSTSKTSVSGGKSSKRK